MIETLQKRRYAKWLTQPLVKELLVLDNPRKWHYQNITNCCSTGFIEDDRIKMHYCKSRLCLVCARIKTASMLNKYYPDLKGRDMRMVTLTSRNVPLKELKDRIAFMKQQLMYVRRLNTRVVGVAMNGLYTVEVTYNPTSKTYHPHVHALLEASADKAHWFVHQWLLACKKHGIRASVRGQHIGQRLTNPKQLLEIFKYVTKFPHGKELKDLKTLRQTAKMVDAIMVAIHNKRMVITFGNIRAHDESQHEVSTITLDTKYEAPFSWASDNWYDQITGEELVPIKIPSRKVIKYKGKDKVYHTEVPGVPKDAWELKH